MTMRFRRRREALPEPESDDSVWAPPAEFPPPDAGAGWNRADLPEVLLPEELAGEPAEEAPAPEERLHPPVPEPAPEPEPALVPEPPPAPAPARKAARWVPGRDAAPPPAEGTVRAAGGVIFTRWRGALRVLLVHRPRYDDWSLPKGKAGPGETDAECALREVQEETGLVCSLGPEIGVTTYHDRHGRPKTVRYFLMEPLGGGATPQAEVDEVRWLAVEEAKELITYQREVPLLDDLVDLVARPESEDEQPSES